MFLSPLRLALITTFSFVYLGGMLYSPRVTSHEVIIMFYQRLQPIRKRHYLKSYNNVYIMLDIYMP